MITAIGRSSFNFTYQNKNFEVYYRGIDEGFRIRDITKRYDFKDSLKKFYGNEVIIISDQLGFYNGIFYYEYECDWYHDEKKSELNYDFPFEYRDVYIPLMNCCAIEIAEYSNESYSFKHTKTGTIIHDPDLIPIIQKLNTNELQCLLEIFKQYNQKWLKYTHKNNNLEYDYELIFEPEE